LHDDANEAQSRAASEDLEAELAALLAADEPLPDEDAAPSAPRQELPLHDGDFSYAMSRDDELREVPVEPVAPVVVAKAPAAPESWALVDDAAAVHADPVPAGTGDFGIEKMSAADFLAPDVEPAAAEFQPTMSLELVSMEEAVAPQAWEPNEMLLDELGSRARSGEVLLVPAEGQVQLRRDGSVELRNHDGAQESSIDASFTMAANMFGRDALGIVFAGNSTDAVAGAQAIHDRGGQVWVEAADGEHYADMVSGIFAE